MSSYVRRPENYLNYSVLVIKISGQYSDDTKNLMMTMSFTRLHLFSLTLLDCNTFACDMPDISVITNDARMKMFVSYSYFRATERNFGLRVQVWKDCVTVESMEVLASLQIVHARA